MFLLGWIFSMENFVAYVQPWLPDAVVRWIVWLYLAYQLRRLNGLDHPMKELRTVKRIKKQEKEEGESKFARVAERTEAANEQHYEVPTEFFVGHLGPCRKYSSCEWGPIQGERSEKKRASRRPSAPEAPAPKNLAEAETYTFDSYLAKMGIEEVPTDGSGRVLEIGCGWGSFLLYAAAKHPTVEFVGFSNSITQIAHIAAEATAKRLVNVKAFKMDINDFCDASLRPVQVFGRPPLNAPEVMAVASSSSSSSSSSTSAFSPMPSRPGSTDLVASPAAFGEPPPLVAAAPSSSPSPLSSSGGGPQGGALLFDRIFSCECLEHSKDYGKAFRAMSEVLKADGKVFVQILCHREYTYFMNNDDWMGRNFFTGGTIPSTKLFMFFTEHLVVDESWYIRGTEYSRTLDAWLANLHSNRRALMHVFQKNGYVSPAREIQKWRMFYIMSSVSFGFNKGKEWMVAYYTFSKR